MYKGLPYLTRCCFCVPLRPGLLVWAYVKLIFNTIFFGCSLIWLTFFGALTGFDFDKHQMYGFALSASAVILCLSDLILTIVLVIGAHKKNTRLLCYIYRYAIVHGVLFLVIGALTIALVISITKTDNDTLRIVVATFSAIYCTFIIIYVYQFLLIRSAIVKLTPNGPVHFFNHDTNPKCYMQVDFQPADNINEEICAEKTAL